MSRRVDFRQDDVSRAIKAALAAGLKLGEFQVEAAGGVVRIVTGKDAEAPAPKLTPYEKWKLQNGGHAT